MFSISNSDVIIICFIVSLVMPIYNSYPTFKQPDQEHTNYLPLNNQFSLSFMDDSIEEVRQMWEQDSSLPRLTRGEIQELYEKVKREDFNKAKNVRDLTRSNGERALMLVLPYNTDNKTRENLQDLYTRPPVTKVIDIYSQPQPIKFVTPDPNAVTKNESRSIQNMSVTTYKPTTYHPPAPPAMQKLSLTATDLPSFAPISNSTVFTEYNAEYIKSKPKTTQRYSSHYNAKDMEFSKLPFQKITKPSSSNTVKPVSEVLKTLGITDQKLNYHQPLIGDFYSAESAPKPVLGSYLVETSQSAPQKINSDSYLSFKPLNIGEEIRIKPEVEGYLTRYGIVRGRNRKNLSKKSYSNGTYKQASEKSIMVVPVSKKSKKSTATDNTELDKLIQNLKELERLNINANSLSTTDSSGQTSTQATLLLSEALITNESPLLTEPNKTRRKIDPDIDTNYSTNGNRQIEENKSDELAKLLENLQELEKLRITPQNALKSITPTIKTANRSHVVITQTSLPIHSQTIINRFSDLILKQQRQQQAQSTKLDQNFEAQQNIEKPTVQPKMQQPLTRDNFSPTDFLQLQKLLGDEAELVRLYEQARFMNTPKSITSTTNKPLIFNQNDLQQLKKYLAGLNRAIYTTESATTSTATTTSILSTSTTTTFKPSTNRNDYSILINQMPKHPASESDDLHKLISRVQQLEQFNTQPTENQSTELPQYFGFLSRNVKTKATANDYNVPINDFAQLQQLYKQVYDADQASFDKVEMSTVSTASKFHEQLKTSKHDHNFVERIEIANNTDSTSSLQKVDANEFIQLQKLLSKVQELERVKLKTDGPEADAIPSLIRTKSQRDATFIPTLTTTASTNKISSAHIQYPEKRNSYKYSEDLLLKEVDIKDLKLDLPIYEVTTPEPIVIKNGSSVLNKTFNEELHKLELLTLPNPENSKNNQYQTIISKLLDVETESYKNMHPPMIYKTITKESPQFISTTKPQEYITEETFNQDNLKELGTVLNNAKQLKELGIILPKVLSAESENKLTKSNYPGNSEINMQIFPVYTSSSANQTGTTISNSTKSFDGDVSSKEKFNRIKQKTVVFSLTTMKSVLPKLPKTTTESTAQLPIFSATKIIEDAIKRAANKIGVSTEHPQGFRRRIDTYANETTTEDSDLIGEYSNMQYQIAIPDINHELEIKTTEVFAEEKPPENIYTEIVERNAENSQNFENESVKFEAIESDLNELQRLINNLQELQKLNVSITPDKVNQADKKYLERFKFINPIEDDHKKSRRQSELVSTSVISDLQTSAVEFYTTKTMDEITTAAPIKFNFDLGLNDSDRDIINKANTNTLNIDNSVRATEESNTSSLADLEDSFGPDPNKKEPLPPKKKNGFYFLADWNSFLEVGDGDDQVVVKLGPKIGDPRLFLPIKIP